jgi:hypothetical protein
MLAQVITCVHQSLMETEFDNYLIQVIDIGSQGDNVACLNSLLTCRYGA